MAGSLSPSLDLERLGDMGAKGARGLVFTAVHHLCVGTVLYTST